MQEEHPEWAVRSNVEVDADYVVLRDETKGPSDWAYRAYCQTIRVMSNEYYCHGHESTQNSVEREKRSAGRQCKARAESVGERARGNTLVPESWTPSTSSTGRKPNASRASIKAINEMR